MPGKRKQKKIKINLNEAANQLNLERHYGPEPDVKGLDFSYNKGAYIDAFNWYWARKDVKDARQYLTDFFTETNEELYPGFLSYLPKIPDEWINVTAAWIARMASRGACIPDKSYEFLYDKVGEMIKHADNQPVKVINVQDSIKKKVSDEIAKLEGMIDDKIIVPGWNFANYCKRNNISPMIASRIADHFRPIYDELIKAYQGTDESISEAYSKYFEEDLEVLIATYMSFAEGVELPKREITKKPKKPEQILKTFVYAKIYEPLKLKSIPPVGILGAKELWTYYPAYKKLTVYRAKDNKGLSVDKKSIINYNTETSFSFNPKNMLSDCLHIILNCSAHEIHSTFDKEAFVDSLLPFTARLNESIILLRVFI